MMMMMMMMKTSKRTLRIPWKVQLLYKILA